ncbi:hypothetical protein [Glutamicibacter sp. BW77]|uniref:hypothetical protein n=1 Tax=Glutamicibacter sp. BW77 TaxID=2024402 RepID=UPI000BB82342|nr:hypothetical protein [Glutamicibacter sp. BW77]PCC37430.1 hypothetical protein CIK74_00485 [Glutamicibacter sp. BW77]
MIIDLWNQTPQEIQAAFLVLTGTILATLISTRTAKANAKEERITEIRHLVSLATDRANAMGVLTRQTLNMLMLKEEQGIHEEQIESVLKEANDAGIAAMQHLMRLSVISDSSVGRAGRLLYRDVVSFKSKYVYLGKPGQWADLDELEADCWTLNDHISIVANMVVPRKYERISRFRSLKGAERLLKRERKLQQKDIKRGLLIPHDENPQSLKHKVGDIDGDAESKEDASNRS